MRKKQTIEQFEQELREKVQNGDAQACYDIVAHFEKKGKAPNQLDAENRILLLEEASNQGVVAASLMLAYWYFSGHYVKEDVAKAMMFYEHAGKHKEPQGFFEISQLFGHGIKVEKNIEKADAYLKKAAEMGHAEAMFQYALRLLEKNQEKSLQLLKDNYNKNKHIESLVVIDSHQQFNQNKIQSYLESHRKDPNVAGLLSIRYLKNGHIKQAKALAEQSMAKGNAFGYFARSMVEQQLDEGTAQNSYNYVLKAAELGHDEAAYQVVLVCLQRYEKAKDAAEQQKIKQIMMPFLERTAHAGMAKAQFTLAQCYLRGQVVEEDKKQGLMWLERAASLGHVDAMFNLAMALPVKNEQHFALLQQAAQRGHVQAMLCAGLYCQKHQDDKNAVLWYDKAAKRGNTRAIGLVGLALCQGKGIAKNSQVGVKLLSDAAKQGDGASSFALYELFRDGQHVERNLELSTQYLKLAQQMNFPPALTVKA